MKCILEHVNPALSESHVNHDFRIEGDLLVSVDSEGFRTPLAILYGPDDLFDAPGNNLHLWKKVGEKTFFACIHFIVE